jgi:hypothetical protein
LGLCFFWIPARHGCSAVNDKGWDERVYSGGASLQKVFWMTAMTDESLFFGVLLFVIIIILALRGLHTANMIPLKKNAVTDISILC